ncbi:hypothetical protein BT67DRAFT_156224 [Trichocladium antarcticum]|uniref:Translation machinery-associated protein 16 n=1 Tax=Trichocladium antarcticum TaxID=1450529 RepID=A0AAN6UEU4_9PEZI|nr:hypothetical protein BT67DRAFT_156224 [Trichocladium antarcticum]
MAKTLEKARKAISKKRSGTIDALHQNSRDSKRLHRAQIRDERLEKLASTKRKHDKPLLRRVRFFRHAVSELGNQPLELKVIQSKIHEYVHQYDEEYEAEKKTRRAGRPSSTKEDLLKMKITALEKEYRDGFYMPDLSTEQNIGMVNRFDGSWTFLNSLAWVKISEAGVVKPSSFPPQGL